MGYKSRGLGVGVGAVSKKKFHSAQERRETSQGFCARRNEKIPDLMCLLRHLSSKKKQKNKEAAAQEEEIR